MAEERAIFTWLREHEEQQAIQRAGAPRQRVEEEPHQAGGIHYQEFLREQQALARAQAGYREQLRAELLAAVPVATRDRLSASQQALRDAQRQQEDAEEALQDHGAALVAGNVATWATEKGRLQNELEAYTALAVRCAQALHDAQRAFEGTLAQLAQQRVWQQEQALQDLQRHWQSEIDSTFQKHQSARAQAYRETKAAIDALERLRLSLS